MVALSSMGNLLFGQGSKSFSSFSCSIKTLLHHHWGLRAARHLHSSWSNFFHPALLYLPFTVVWTAVVHTSHTVTLFLFVIGWIKDLCMRWASPWFISSWKCILSLDPCVTGFALLVGDMCGVLIGPKHKKISEQGEHFHHCTNICLHQTEFVWLRWKTQQTRSW